MIHRTPADFLDRNTYPLDQPESKTWTELVNKCKKSLNETGACILKNFVHQSILDRMVLETERIVDKSHFCKDNHNVFFEKDDTSLPVDHPLRIREDTSLNSIPYDLMNPADALHQLYNW